MNDVATLRVSGNTPRLLKEGERPPAPAEQELPPEELEVPSLYWTPDKAQHIVARLCHAGSKFYGPSVKAAEWELELIGDPAAAVMNDWVPLRVGASSDKWANLIALGVVTAIIVALRLPDILEVHGVIKPWQSKRPQAAAEQETPQLQPAFNPAPAAAAPAPPAQPGSVAGTFEPQLVGASGHVNGGGDESKVREQVYGAQTVGGGGSFVASNE